MPIRRTDRPSVPGNPCARAAARLSMSFGSYMLAPPSLDRLFGIRQTVAQAVRPAPSGRTRRPALLTGNGSSGVLELLGRTCCLLGDSCGRPELPRRDADEALEVMAELALVREAGAGGDLRQGQVGSCLQELPGPLDAAHDHVLVRRQPGGCLELPGEVVDAQMGRRGHLLQSQAGVEVFLDVLDDGAEPPLRQHAVPPALGPAGCRDVPDQ